jgi:hypothetical protein
MLLALEFLLLGQLATGFDGAVLRLDVDRVGTDRLGRARRGPATPGTRDLEAGGEALKIALLLGREVTGHCHYAASTKLCRSYRNSSTRWRHLR